MKQLMEQPQTAPKQKEILARAETLADRLDDLVIELEEAITKAEK